MCKLRLVCLSKLSWRHYIVKQSAMYHGEVNTMWVVLVWETAVRCAGLFAYLFAIACQFCSLSYYCVVRWAYELLLQWEYHVCRCHACDIKFFEMISFMHSNLLFFLYIGQYLHMNKQYIVHLSENRTCD